MLVPFYNSLMFLSYYFCLAKGSSANHIFCLSNPLDTAVEAKIGVEATIEECAETMENLSFQQNKVLTLLKTVIGAYIHVYCDIFCSIFNVNSKQIQINLCLFICVHIICRTVEKVSNTITLTKIVSGLNTFM